MRNVGWTRLFFGLAVIAMCSLASAACGQDANQGVIEAAPQEPGGFWVFIREILGNLFDSRALMETLGKPQYAIAAFIALNVIIFTETGLLIGFCLPGDSLLVTAGLIASNPICQWNVSLLLATLCIAAIVGDSVGYSIGFKTGPKIFNRENSFLFHKDHLLKAQHFYEKHGGKTIILARFMPIIRTFAPVVAGVGRMHYPRFLMFNIVGGVGWVCSMVLFGLYLPAMINPLLQPIFGQQFLVENHVEKVVIVVVLVSISPGIVMWLRSRFAKRANAEEPALTAAGHASE